ncbi:MAG: helix-turn-helix domain-containing protein [Sporolactobacillus sp.]|jgi:transcriptional regulator with XRE-family HTH domain|nr:helix-turn-helix domain-containing protein [Sporolactobacillus sp.]
MLDGKTIQRLRLLQGLTQTELAEVVGVNQPFICKIEHGKKHVPERLAERLEQALDLTGATWKILESGEWR